MSGLDSPPGVLPTSKMDLSEKGPTDGKEPEKKKAKIDDANDNTNEVAETHKIPDQETTLLDFLNGLQKEDIYRDIPEWFLVVVAKYSKISNLLEDNRLFEQTQEFVKFDLTEFLKTGKKKIIDKGLRIAVQDYKFDVTLTHNADVEALKKRMEKVRQWHSKSDDRDRYIAPLLPVIQSSGTGKSRVLFELRKQLKEEGKFCRSILLTDRNKEESLAKEKLTQQSPDNKAYDEVYNVTNEVYNVSYYNKSNFRDFILQQCKECIENKKLGHSVDVTLFFDEAQHLTGRDGKLFKSLRWMTRQKHFPTSFDQHEFKIVVVLAGTTSSLANSFPEPQISSGTSRVLGDEANYYTSGKVPYEPFYTLRTQGCLSNQTTQEGGSEQGEGSEYDQMIRFSRPLFQVLKQNGKWDTDIEYDIAKKIVLGDSNWTKNAKSCLSVLATRVQMGTTSTLVVSELVSKGYAHLTFFRNKDSNDSGIPSVASFAFLPDPFCARMAMCLMDETFEFQFHGQRSRKPPSPIKGASKTFIAKQMGTIFSSGLCLPAKGDFGEIAVALYLLFCGDILRAEKNDKYHSLSVDFTSWIECVWNKGRKSQPTTNCEEWEGLEINCIQFFHYAFRSSLKELCDNTFLGSLYRKGCAIYCPTNTEAIGLVIPCHDVNNDPNNGTYIPIFVSVKNYATLYPETAISFLEKSYNALKSLGIDKGLLLLGIAGQDRKDVNSAMYENGWEQAGKADILVTANEAKDFRGKLCVGCFCVHDDEFNINKMLQDSSFSKAQQKAEVYSMHSELIHVEKSDQNKDIPRYNQPAKDFYTETLGIVKKRSQS